MSDVATLQTAAQQGATSGAEVAFSWGGYFQAIGIMMLLLAALWLGLWAVRKYGKFRFMPSPEAFPRGGLQLETQLPLGPRKGLMVVRYLDERLLLGVTDHQLTLLRATPLQPNTAEAYDSSSAADKQDFAHFLKAECAAPSTAGSAAELAETASAEATSDATNAVPK